MTRPERVEVLDYHTGGEPFRIVPGPPIPLPGTGVADRRARAMVPGSDADLLRRFLCHEPRGHTDMYGGLITEPDDAGAHFGVLFFHKDGFSTACGHGTIALGRWAVDAGLVQAPHDGEVDVVIDVPSGRVTARVQRAAGRTVAVGFVSVPSHLVAEGVPVRTALGDVVVDIGFGGTFYAHLDLAQVGLTVEPRRIGELRALGREITRTLYASDHVAHEDERLSFMYGTVLYEDLGPTPDGGRHQRNVVIFADGQVDRSPCGSGTASRVAVLDAQGALAPDAQLQHDSIVGSRFVASVVDRVAGPGRPAVVPLVTGMAHPTGTQTFVRDEGDELADGFLLG